VAGPQFPATDENGVTAGTVRINAEGTSYGYSPFSFAEELMPTTSS
jgi:hypothetical protein